MFGHASACTQPRSARRVSVVQVLAVTRQASVALSTNASHSVTSCLRAHPALQEQRLPAVAYARQHLAPWASQHMPELQRALATLALPASTRLPAYKALFEEGQWDSLLELFQRELTRMHCLLPESQLSVLLQVGLQRGVCGVCCGWGWCCASDAAADVRRVVVWLQGISSLCLQAGVQTHA